MHDVDQELTVNGEFLPWLYMQTTRHSLQAQQKSRAAAAYPAEGCGSQQPTPKPQEVRAATLPHLTQHGPLDKRHPLTIEQHTKYLGVTLSSDGSLTQGRSHTCCKSTQTLQLAAPVLAKHRPHTEVEVTHLQCGIYSARDIRAGISSTHKGRLRQTRSLPLTESAEDTPLQKHLLHRGAKPHSPYIHQPGGESTHLTAPPHAPHPQSTAEAFRAHSSIPSEQYRTELLFY